MISQNYLNMITNIIRTEMHLYNSEDEFLNYVIDMIIARENGDRTELRTETQNKLSAV